MESLRDIRSRIQTVKSTQQVTRAMKMVAAAKLRKAQEQIFATRPYSFKLREIINQIRGRVSSSTHPLFEKREEVRSAILVVVTGDRGLAGAFNTNVIKEVEAAIERRYASLRQTGGLRLMCLGRKGHDRFVKSGIPLLGDHRGIFQQLVFDDALRIVDTLIDGYLERRWDEVSVVYNEFRNTIAQNRIVEPFLPLPEEEFVTPVMEKSDAYQREQEHAFEIDYLFEPDAQGILHELLPRYLNFQMWRILLESNAAEQGARMVAMDNATSNAGELLRQLRLNYNRARQAAITTEIVEISSGAEALASQE